MITDEEFKKRNKEFRKYLKGTEGYDGFFLKNIMASVSGYLKDVIEMSTGGKYACLYETPLDTLVEILVDITSDDSFIARKDGYISILCISKYVQYECVENGIDMESKIKEVKDKREEQRKSTEGREIDTEGIRYERDPKVRDACIKHYGCHCYVCGFDFEKTYGLLGKDFIEVHHRVPISQRGGEYVVNPIKDLVPLCSNCHSMVHRHRDCVIDVEELKKLLSGDNTV